jgi:thiosulfate/3-mercaptopyruvate sulfurtransferase
MSEITWNYEEFACFLLIYVSHVDMEFSAEEVAKIKSKFSYDTFDKMLDEFNSVNDFEALEKILACKGVYYPTEDRKNELLDKIKDQFFVDGDYSIMEKALYAFMRRLM